MAYIAFLYLCGLNLALKPIEVINTFLDLTKSYFGSEDVIFVLSIMANFNDMSKGMYLSLLLISNFFLTLQQPQFFMFTAVNSPSVNFTSQNVFQLEQPW